jgi:hypothetical protein
VEEQTREAFSLLLRAFPPRLQGLLSAPQHLQREYATLIGALRMNSQSIAAPTQQHLMVLRQLASDDETRHSEERARSAALTEDPPVGGGRGNCNEVETRSGVERAGGEGGRGKSGERGGDGARWGGGEMRRLGVGGREGHVRDGGRERRPNCAEAGKSPSVALTCLDDVALPEESLESGLEFVAGIALFRIHSCINHRQACARALSLSASSFLPEMHPEECVCSTPASITVKFGGMRSGGGEGGGEGGRAKRRERGRGTGRSLLPTLPALYPFPQDP